MWLLTTLCTMAHIIDALAKEVQIAESPGCWPSTDLLRISRGRSRMEIVIT